MSKLTIPCLIACSFLFIATKSYAQDWNPGYYYDTNGNKETGFIRMAASSPIKGEAAIEFKENKKAPVSIVTASGLKSFIMGRDSFVVASAPQEAQWRYDYDFVDVLLDNDELKLYMFTGYPGDGGGSGVHSSIGIGLGTGFGSYGSHFGGGIGAGFSIPLGHSSARGGGRAVYYYGANTAQMRPLTPVNFVDIMSEIMGDEPTIVDRLRDNKYSLRNMDKLLHDFYKAETAHPAQ